jgi:hypothetical protein
MKLKYYIQTPEYQFEMLRRELHEEIDGLYWRLFARTRFELQVLEAAAQICLDKLEAR